MRIAPIFAAASLVAVSALGAVPAIAATKAAAKPAAAKVAPAKPAGPAGAGADTPQQHALIYLRYLIAGLQSEKVEEPAKAALVGCLYNNSLGKITESMDKVIAENPGKIHRENGTEVLTILVRVCGYTPKPAAGAAAPGVGPAKAPPAPASTAPAPAGR